MSISNRPLDDIYAERVRQDEKWGPNPRHVDFDPRSRGRYISIDLDIPSASQAKERCERYAREGSPPDVPWSVILLEEVCEAMEEVEDTQKLRTELIQVAAVCAGWVQDIDSRPKVCPSQSKAQHPSGKAQHVTSGPPLYVHRMPDDIIPPHAHHGGHGSHSGHVRAPEDRGKPTEQEWQQHWGAEAQAVRTFPTGADRDVAEGKPDYARYLAPRVLERFGQYMLEHSTRKDGTQRPGDNWQKGMPVPEYTSSLLRHTFHAWGVAKRIEELEAVTACDVEEPTADLLHAQYEVEECIEALCGVLFNAMGIIFELTRTRSDA